MKLKKCYENICSHTTKIQKFIKTNNIFKAKVCLGDLFIELSDCSRIMDLYDLNDLKDFKDLFLSNIKYPALFGKVTLRNHKLIETKIEQLNKQISEKLIELNEYLEICQNY